jgi:hypothetical protein
MSREAAEEIRLASLPKARRSGELAYDKATGAVSLEGSLQAGVEVGSLSTMGRRLDRAATGIATKESAEMMATLAKDFEAEIQRIGKAKYSDNDQRWRQVSNALNVQHERETALQLGSNAIAKDARDAYRAELSKLVEGGDYSPEKLKAFDGKSQKIAKRVKSDSRKLLKRIRGIDYRGPGE